MRSPERAEPSAPAQPPENVVPGPVFDDVLLGRDGNVRRVWLSDFAARRTASRSA